MNKEEINAEKNNNTSARSGVQTYTTDKCIILKGHNSKNEDYYCVQQTELIQCSSSIRQTESGYSLIACADFSEIFFNEIVIITFLTYAFVSCLHSV